MAEENHKKKSPGELEAAPPAGSTTAILRLDLLRSYKLSWLPGDLLAGVVVFAVTIPAALAYGRLAGLHAVNGLYASLLAMGVYAFFGTSRQLIIDAEAAVAILVATSVAAVASGGDPARFAALAALQALMVGVIQLVGGVLRVGFFSDFIPKSVVIGFLNGMALIIIMAQVDKIWGIELTQHDFIPRVWEFYTKINQAHQLTLAIGGGCLLGLIIFSFVPIIPEAVVVVVLATVVVVWGNLGADGVSLVGTIPPGLPKLELPPIDFADILNLLPIATGVALVSYVDTTITGRAFALRGGYRLDNNQEMIALGLANIGTGLFHGFTVGSSHSRTAINEMYGGKSQLAGLIAASLLALFLVRYTYLLQNVPIVALAAIIMMAGFRLFNLKEVIRSWRTRPASAYFNLATTAAVLIAGIMIGILVAVVFAIVLALHRLARPHETITRPPAAPDVLIYRFGAPLFFFNANHFASRVRELIESARPQVTFLLINAEAIVDMDVNAVDMLEELFGDLKSRGIVLGICEAKGHFQKVLNSTKLTGQEGFNQYCTVAEAVRELRKKHELSKALPKEEGVTPPETPPGV
jgi:sulfate permease, SulP family